MECGETMHIKTFMPLYFVKAGKNHKPSQALESRLLRGTLCTLEGGSESKCGGGSRSSGRWGSGGGLAGQRVGCPGAQAGSGVASLGRGALAPIISLRSAGRDHRAE